MERPDNSQSTQGEDAEHIHAGPFQARILLLIVQASVAVFGQEAPVDPFTPAPVERKQGHSPTSNSQGRLDSNQSQIPETRVRGTGARGRLRLLLVDGKNDQTYILPDSRSIELPQKPGHDEPDHLISMRLSRASLSDFFRLLDRLSDLNILIDPDVKGTVTLNVTSVGAVRILETVLESHHLVNTEGSELMRIMTHQTARREEEVDRRGSETKKQAAPRRTLVRQLNYANVKTLSEQIQKHGSFLSDQATLVVDERTNTLFVTDLEASLERLQEMLEKVALPQPQVEIEARIVEVTTGFAREIGTEFGFQVGSPGARTRAAGRLQNPGSAGNAVLSFLSGRLIDTLRLDAMLSAGEVEGRARMLSKPRVSVQNNEEAIITQGSKIPIPVHSNFSTRVRFETAALGLTVKPRITGQNTVLLKLKLENNVPDFTQTVFGIPTILTTEANTVVLVPDGGTAVVGGIRVETDRHSETRVPGLARIPVLRGVFRKTSNQRETREILFFLTLKIQTFDFLRGQSTLPPVLDQRDHEGKKGAGKKEGTE